MNSGLLTLFLLWALVLVADVRLEAYIDPGTGSYIFQLTIAGFFAAAYAVRRYWRGIKSTISGIRRRRG